MSNGQTAQTPDEWKKDKEAAEAETAALDARKKLIEARTALATAEAAARQHGAQQELQDKLAAVKAGKDIADANKATAEARKAASEADLAAFKASIGEVPVSGYTGRVELKPDAGKFEAALLAARAVRTAARKIAGVVTARGSVKKTDKDGKDVMEVGTIVAYGAAELPKLDAWTTFSVQVSLARTAFQEAEALTSKAGVVEVAELEVAQLEGVPMAAAAGLTLDAVNKLLGYFRTDYEIGGFELTLEDSLLVNAVAGALRDDGWDVRIPARYDANTVAAAKSIIDTVTEFSRSNARGKDLQQRHAKTAADLADAAAKEADPSKKQGLRAEAKSHRDAAEAWKAAITLYEGVYGKLTQADDKGVIPLATLVREGSLVEALEAGAKLLIVKLHTSGGAYYTVKNLWTLFGGMPLHHMGGTVAAFMLFAGRTGNVVAADVVPVHGGFVKAGDLEQTLP